MADDPAVRAPVRRIKIKFGNKLVSTHSVRVPGLLSSASQDSKETRQGSALHLARLRQASLQGYVSPSATADAIVARLRDGEGFAPGSELPPWDFMAPPAIRCQERPVKRSRPSPCGEESRQQSCQAPAAAAAVVPACREGVGPGPSRPERSHDVKQEPAVKAEPTPECAALAAVTSGESNSDQATNSQAYLPLSPDDTGNGATREGPAAAAGNLQPHASSADQPSLTCAAQLDSLPLKESRPKSASAKALTAVASASASVLPAQPKAPRANAASATATAAAATAAPRSGPSARVAESWSPLRGSTGRGDVPSTSGWTKPSVAPVKAQPPPPALAAAVAPTASATPSGVSVETQTSQRDFPVLPLSFLELPQLCGTALSFQSIGPFDLQLEEERLDKERRTTADGRKIESIIEEAKRTKREGDHMAGAVRREWTVKSLSKYVSASLIFMEAADIISHKRDQRYNPRFAADLYRQTADLLVHTVALADTIRNNSLGKEALRLLAERLCAVCLLRHTSLMAGAFKACTDKAQAALREHHKQQQQQQLHGAGAAGVGLSVSGQQPSPEDSSTSSHHATHLAGSAAANNTGATAGAPGGSGSSSAPQPLAGFGHEQLADLLSYARTTWRFSEYMKRSSKSFEAFLERPDVRQDQQAKLVCMHLAAVCMDVGMTPGMRVILHAREAVRTLCDDLAR